MPERHAPGLPVLRVTLVESTPRRRGARARSPATATDVGATRRPRRMTRIDRAAEGVVSEASQVQRGPEIENLFVESRPLPRGLASTARAGAAAGRHDEAAADAPDADAAGTTIPSSSGKAED